MEKGNMTSCSSPDSQMSANGARVCDVPLRESLLDRKGMSQTYCYATARARAPKLTAGATRAPLYYSARALQRAVV